MQMMENFKKYISSGGLCMNATKSELLVFCCGRLKKKLHFGAQMDAKDDNLLVVRQGFTFGKTHTHITVPGQ